SQGGAVRYQTGEASSGSNAQQRQTERSPCQEFECTREPKMRIHVEQHADHRGMPMAWRLHFGGDQADVLEALDQWYGPDYRYIKVRGHDGGVYILCFDELHAEWGLTMYTSARAQMRMYGP